MWDRIGLYVSRHNHKGRQGCTQRWHKDEEKKKKKEDERREKKTYQSIVRLAIQSQVQRPNLGRDDLELRRQELYKPVSLGNNGWATREMSPIVELWDY